jgi:hypothetical protein
MKQFLAINHHENACVGSQKFANHLINYLYNKMLANAGDVDIDKLIQFYLVYLTNWNEAYVNWRDSLNFQMSTTAEMELLDIELTDTKAPEWVVKIWSIYAQGTPKATALLPHARKPIITGSAIEKISGMNTLIKGIGTDLSLKLVKDDITAFVTNYTTKSQQHAAAMKTHKDLSKDQEALRLITTAAMLHCEGGLTEKYWQTPEKVDLYFDISAMRRRQSSTTKDDAYPVELLPSEIKLIGLDYTFKDIWEVANDGEKDACIFFGKTSTITVIPAIKFVIPAGGSLQIDLSTLDAEMRFAYAANLSAEDEGTMTIVLLTKPA